MNADALEYLRRNSGLSLDSEGVFYSMGQKVPNDRVQQLFHEGIAVLESGDVTLTLGRVWAYVKPRTVARFVTGLKIDGDNLNLFTINGARSTSDSPRVGMAPDNRFYLWEHETAYPSILLRQAHHELAELLEERDGDIGFVLGQHWVSIQELSTAPGPADLA